MKRAALAAGLGILVAAAPAAAAPLGVRATLVSVTLADSKLVVTPSKIPTGPIVFRIANTGTTARRFAVGGRRTPMIAGGRTATLKLDLRARGPYEYVSTGRGRAVRLTGVLTVFEPCTHPTETTVRVTMDHDRSGITFSEPTIPCGTVTFVVTNIGGAVDSLQVFADYPNASGTTPELRPGQTARLTIRFTEKGVVSYQSGDYLPSEPEFGGGDADGGSLRIV